MEDTVSTTRERTAGKDEKEEADNTVLMNSKPLHRFVQREPRSLGIVMLMSGCAELMMGFILAGVSEWTSYKIYIPFWQGALFLICGILSVYTELQPSKRMVTVCLAMYVVTLLGVLVSFGYRGYCFGWLGYRYHGSSRFHIGQTLGVEIVLLFFSICVSAILIFLIVVARFALKSTRTQVIVHHIPLPRNGTPAD